MERKAYSIPLNVQIPTEAIRYSDVRSRVEIASEVTPVVNFRNSNLKVLYEDLKMSSSSVGKAIGVSEGHAFRLLHGQGVSFRNSRDPIYLDRRVSAVREVFKDPNRRAEIVAKIHKPGSDIKRGSSLRKKYETDSEYKKRQLEFARSATAAHVRASQERRMQRAFESLEQERLKREREMEFAIKLLENPALGTLSPQQRKVVELRFRTDGFPQLTLRQVGEMMGVSYQAVQQYETQALVKLGFLKKHRGRKS